MCSGGEKVTAIFVGGAMEERHWKELAKAKSLYPPQTDFYFFTNPLHKTLGGTPERSRAKTPADIWDNLPSLFRRLKTGDSLHLVQFGHGGGSESEPYLINRLFKGQDNKEYSEPISTYQLVGLFEKNFNSAERPVTTLIFGGCYSGGFAKRFLASEFSPDFFFAASPPGLLAFGSLSKFLASNAKDYNSDGVVTLRERAIYEMNEGHNPLAVMFSNGRGFDVDMSGQNAKKPYFPREIKRVKDHETLLRTIEGLCFGEQVVVLVPGGPGKGIDEKLLRWFEKEARGGAGFYKFIVVDDNPSSRYFFKSDKEPRLFVMGRNLNYKGVPLKMSRPIADQIPSVLGNIKPFLVITDWLDWKLPPRCGMDTQVDRYLQNVISEPAYHDSLLRKIREILNSKEEGDYLRGLRLARLAYEKVGGKRKELNAIVNHFLSKYLKGPKKPTWDNFELMFEILNWPEPSSEHILAMFELPMSKLHREAFNSLTQYEGGINERISAAYASAFEEKNKDIDEVVKILNSLVDNRISISNESFYKFLKEKGLRDPNRPELRLASARYLAKLGPLSYKDWRDILIQQWSREKESEIKIQLLEYLAGIVAGQDELGEFNAMDLSEEAEKLIKSDQTPHSLKIAAKKYLRAIDEFSKKVKADWEEDLRKLEEWD